MAFEDLKGTLAITPKARCYVVRRGPIYYHRFSYYEDWAVKAGIDPEGRVTVAIGREEDVGSFAVRQRVSTDKYRGFTQTPVGSENTPSRSRVVTISNPEIAALMEGRFAKKKTVYMTVRIAPGYLIFTPED